VREVFALTDDLERPQEELLLRAYGHMCIIAAMLM
jgi:hypothetical protein